MTRVYSVSEFSFRKHADISHPTSFHRTKAATFHELKAQPGAEGFGVSTCVPIFGHYC